MGAQCQSDGSVFFKVWAPWRNQIDLKLFDSKEPRKIPMKRDVKGVFSAKVSGLTKGMRYAYLLEGSDERPDPVSRFLPEGVHGPSAIVDPQEFKWRDPNWSGLPLVDFVIYELHVGTFTPQGTFEAIIPKLAYLKKLGITCIELMPLAQFPGGRNWR